MAQSDEFSPDRNIVEGIVEHLLRPELLKIEAETGLAPQVQFHVHVQGKDTEVFGEPSTPWVARLIFRRTYNEHRVLVQVQARPAQTLPSGFSGFVVKGEFSPNDIRASFKKTAFVSEYNTNGFRRWS
ncbi:hypothetical protein OPU71_21000 [Niveibacterium sp. 24ML]|uniref:hypothetical protein n=1 Tax=Niveibacterium sp. 24ML TaxID=2985512 RepID=UPI00226DE64D|nr:hypothetical protein [Niveibacterium sp. 24ML]MCX9158599.1 hypothetical protein [Niveibacterium sp. 24ML]